MQFVGSLAQALDARDAYTAGHSRRVSEYSCAIAKAMKIPEQELETIRDGRAAARSGQDRHLRSGSAEARPPDAGRERLIQQHPVIGKRILENVQGLEAYLDIVELHHENLDGTGYPHGLKGEETPLHARIVKVADAYDAMTSDRPYRRGKESRGGDRDPKKSVSGLKWIRWWWRRFAALGDQQKQRRGCRFGIESLHSLSQARGIGSGTGNSRAEGQRVMRALRILVPVRGRRVGAGGEFGV